MNDPTQRHTPAPPHNDAALRAALERLRREGSAMRAQHPEPGARADQVVTELEEQLHDSDATLQDALRKRVQTAMRDFEAEHPDFTAALGQFLAALGNMGI